MNEVFRERTVEVPVEPQEAPQSTKPIPADELKGFEDKMQDEATKDEKVLEIWEGMHRRKYATEYFNLGNIDGEFNLKMDTSIIDKYIKGELENKKYEKNVDNWKSILQEIETSIGSERMEVFTRIKKIVGYIRVMNKFNKAKEAKKLYVDSFRDD